MCSRISFAPMLMVVSTEWIILTLYTAFAVGGPVVPVPSATIQLIQEASLSSYYILSEEESDKVVSTSIDYDDIVSSTIIDETQSFSSLLIITAPSILTTIPVQPTKLPPPPKPTKGQQDYSLY